MNLLRKASRKVCSSNVKSNSHSLKSVSTFYTSPSSSSSCTLSSNLWNLLFINHSKMFSTQTEPSSSNIPALVPVIPSNLYLDDLKIFDPPVEPKIAPIEYFFPILNCPETIPVLLFHKPGEVSDTPAPLNTDIFSVAIRKDIILECIRYQRHKQRQPKKTKRMSEIAGSNKKPRPQKGTGSAQVGHKRNSVWRGGQKAFGPVIRDYSIGMNKKQRALGMMIALAAKFREGNLLVVDNLILEVILLNV